MNFFFDSPSLEGVEGSIGGVVDLSAVASVEADLSGSGSGVGGFGVTSLGDRATST